MTSKKPRAGSRSRVKDRDAVIGPSSLAHHRPAFADEADQPNRQDVALECGWGKLILAHTYAQPEDVAREVQGERAGARNIAIYVRDPHVILAQAPQQLFLDPSHTFRLALQSFAMPDDVAVAYRIRRLNSMEDAEAINRIYLARQMVPADPGFLWTHRDSPNITYLVAEDPFSGAILGTVTGVDHVHAFGDPEGGSSLWCLAVDPGATMPGIGQALVCHLAEHFRLRDRAFMDLSVMHDNEQAIALYEKLGFERVPVFSIKRKNAINERLFTSPAPDDAALNIYARIIVNAARRRGVDVEILDASAGYFRLTLGGRSVTCRESLSELTTAIAMSRCQDKRVTQRILSAAGLAVPEQREADGSDDDVAFLQQHGAVVVKPSDGEQGQGISVDLRDAGEMREAIERARQFDSTVLIERYCPGQDLRIVVIGYKVVAAALRKPPVVTGDGQHSIAELIAKLSRRRAAATGGESTIPMDAETERCVRLAGYAMDAVLDEGVELAVRKTANLHTGGTLHDVTHFLHPRLCAAAVDAAKALEIPVTGLDFLVRSPALSDYVIVEANERPGLANHEPQPTAERFLDFMFPFSITRETTYAQDAETTH
ncbi:N-acetylglutaminylglutamine synthetase [Sinimarinibacterium sp. CAU 1509]|uniref:N-acetylglutaminylglutamine synthetase n=1 Tax=Sinimarinibacterium sp. CAU 1509 TaxID=2562283 RepID=UPI0010AC1203|nr:N-acetylglutaminylglutamine synthetase [Sinimarinibacterium sp. CAU 1509]TJY59961.1 N-acetylglutaminylglutamine synthetase [Sinimarinibacterium sp. CAU 1509]